MRRLHHGQRITEVEWDLLGLEWYCDEMGCHNGGKEDPDQRDEAAGECEHPCVTVLGSCRDRIHGDEDEVSCGRIPFGGRLGRGLSFLLLSHLRHSHHVRRPFARDRDARGEDHCIARCNNPAPHEDSFDVFQCTVSVAERVYHHPCDSPAELSPPCRMGIGRCGDNRGLRAVARQQARGCTSMGHGHNRRGADLSGKNARRVCHGLCCVI